MLPATGGGSIGGARQDEHGARAGGDIPAGGGLVAAFRVADGHVPEAVPVEVGDDQGIAERVADACPLRS